AGGGATMTGRARPMPPKADRGPRGGPGEGTWSEAAEARERWDHERASEGGRFRRRRNATLEASPASRAGARPPKRGSGATMSERAKAADSAEGGTRPSRRAQRAELKRGRRSERAVRP